MASHSVVHSTFTIERSYPASPGRVFAAFADPATKRRWFASEHERAATIEHTVDFRVGGREEKRFRLPNGDAMRNDTVYQDIVPDRRIVFAYTMTHGEKVLSAALATVEIEPAGEGTRLTYTEQNALLDGADAFLGKGKVGSLEEGWRSLLGRLDEALRAAR